MNPAQLRPWWLRKRILFPVALVAGVAVAVVIAFLNSSASTIVIYNETGHPLPPLLVRACGHTKTFPAIGDEESVCIPLQPDGRESAIHLELVTEPPWQWDGSSVKPRGGQRVTIRIWPGDQVEAFTEISWWQQAFN